MIKIKVNGLYCAWCADHVREHLAELFKPCRIYVDIKHQTVTIFSRKKLNRSRLKKGIIERGYGPVDFVE